MRIVFMGTPAAAVPSLDALVEAGHGVVAVWTQPDKPAGRGNKLKASAVKERALELGLTVYQPPKIKTAEARALFASHDADVAVVVAYGKILPPEFLGAPKRGCINVHFSLLPKWRGAAPVNWAIIAGDETTGVTTMRMDEGLDTGAILLQRETRIDKRETAGELMNRLAIDGARLLIETLDNLDSIKPQTQTGEASYAGLLTREVSPIDWNASAVEIERKVRGLQPSPSAHSVLNNKRMIMWRVETVSHDSELTRQVSTLRATPDITSKVATATTSIVSEQITSNTAQIASGEIVKAYKDDLVVACESGASFLKIIEAQPEGKRKMSAREMINGMRIEVGARFELNEIEAES